MATHSYVLILDFGSQYTQLIARRVRENRVYCEIHPFDRALESVQDRMPSAIILSGGPASVYDPGAPQLDRAILELGVPVLGICYGLQAIIHTVGGSVEPAREREYGKTLLTRVSADSLLFQGVPQGAQVWMSHGDRVVRLPEGFRGTAGTDDSEIAAFESADSRISGVQFHPEVVHTPHGNVILRNFLFEIARLEPDWSM
ncbi:MAG: glutamine-hydrolyzing GMP synthase, partial [Deltaproteobacteria bacterium]|nr:glutamine-hydrolyzing GMP synthase [Deltaproteobacteria bacterium]